ncbi:hypothetical protein BKA64DRAFT_722357 [Cadophora sp. MPI-SDFR-AT-0126]|nr:hypothetical protein BKA64DRAFT_722357 [Leotiomycetes sp. MPI-SDFR-AT-0126]
MYCAPGKLLDLCEAVGVQTVVLPVFMQDSIHLHGRQTSDESSSIDSGPSTTASAVTATSTQAWGLPATTSTATLFSEPDTPFTVVYVWLEGPSITTLVATTTVAPWESPFTSTTTAQDSPVATRIVGVPYTASSTSTTQTSSSTGTQTPTPTPPPVGLSLGAKVGLGVSIPFAAIGVAIGLFIYLQQKRKGTRKSVVEPQETDEGGLPEHFSDIPKVNLSKFPDNPNGFRQVHELGDDQESRLVRRELHELNNEAATLRHEMNARDNPGDDTLARTARENGSTDSNTVSLPHNGRQEIPTATQSAQTNQAINSDPRSSALEGEENEEVREMQQEMVHIQARREQLQRLQALEAREKELKRTIEERKARGES